MTSPDRQNLFDIPVCSIGLQQMLQLQQQQWLGFLAWQQAVLAMQRELYDQWLVRYADGARLDD